MLRNERKVVGEIKIVFVCCKIMISGRSSHLVYRQKYESSCVWIYNDYAFCVCMCVRVCKEREGKVAKGR